MAIKGLESFNMKNPLFELNDFLKYIPKFKAYLEDESNLAMFEAYKEICNDMIAVGYYGKLWPLAMSYGIAHFLTLGAVDQVSFETGTAQDIADTGQPRGIITSYSVGEMSQSIELDGTTVNDKDAVFWNKTEYGASLMALRSSIFTPMMFIGTPGHR